MNKSHILFRTNPNLVMLDDEYGQSMLWNTNESWERPVGVQTAMLISLFAVPRTVGSAITAIQTRYQNMSEQEVQNIIYQLHAEQLIVSHEPVGTLTTVGKGGLFGAPVLSLADALQGSTTNIVFIGVPYDVGVTNYPGCRFAPSYLRRVSSALFRYGDGESGPPGVWDPVSEKRLLQGIRLADVGDMASVVFDRNGVAFDNLEKVIGNVAKANKLPVTIGGDHSISLPIIRGLANAHGSLGVIHFDAHSDYGGSETLDWREACHHGNFMNWVISDERVERVVQFGIRQLTTNQPSTHPKLSVWSGLNALSCSSEELLSALPDYLPYHVTIDVDCLDPTTIPTTGTPLPGGFSHLQLVWLVDLLCRHRRVVGIDVVELIPSSSEREGLIVADVLLKAIAAMTDGGET